MAFIDACQSAAISLMQLACPMRGGGRVAMMVSRRLLRAGAAPVVTAPMRLGHRMVLDTRVPTELWAAYSGRYHDSKIADLTRRMAPGAVVLDVGANVGLYAVPLGMAAGRIGGRVIAFEPHPANRARLLENLRLNGLGGVVAVRSEALSAAAGRQALTELEDFADGGATGNAALETGPGTDPGWRRLSVELAALDALWPSLGCERLDVVKIDIEGHEDQFLAGAAATLARFRPAILMEVNRGASARRGVDLDRAIPALLPEGYEIRLGGRTATLAEVPELADVLLLPRERA